MATADYKQLKKVGFMPQVQKDHFSMRLRIAGGQIQADKLKKVYEIANKYGEGYIHMTSRQSIEIPYIKFEDIEAVKKELAEAGLEPAAGGARVRTITACQGSAICPSGLIDSTGIAREFDERYYGREVPHKFKLGITGCRNNCLKAEENDLGVKGGMMPTWVESKCNYCGLCETVCRVKAIKVNKDDKKLTFDKNECINCGRCVKACRSSAWEGKSGFVVYFGGLYGNRISIGKQLLPILFTKEELHKVVEATLEFFNKNGKPGERFGNTLERVGWDLLKKALEDALA
ncbi:MAG TPA: 4Fe-4S binding protein [Clostridia bacterium]